MSKLKCGITESDLSLLFDAVKEWEQSGLQFRSILELIRRMPPLPDDMPDDVKEWINKAKAYFVARGMDKIK